MGLERFEVGSPIWSIFKKEGFPKYFIFSFQANLTFEVSKKKDLQSNWFHAKLNFAVFFLAQEFTNIKNCLDTIKELSIGNQ